MVSITDYFSRLELPFTSMYIDTYTYVGICMYMYIYIHIYIILIHTHFHAPTDLTDRHTHIIITKLMIVSNNILIDFETLTKYNIVNDQKLLHIIYNESQ